MNEDVKQMRSAFLESLETARRCERSGVGWPDWVETELDALIAAVEREALERAFGIGDVYVEPVFMGAVPGWEKGGAYYDGYVKGATDYREGIRALIESKEG